jgi:dTDP-glucose 4,6-dehydratase
MWEEKHVFITGGTGFIGSHLADALVKKGAKVFIYTRFEAVDTFEAVRHLLPNVKIIWGDLTDYDGIQKALKEAEPNVIYHAGAVTRVPYSFERPFDTLNTNITAILSLLEYCKDNEVERIINFGSSEQYGNTDVKYIPFKEDAPLVAGSPYAASKICCDNLCQVYYKSYEIPVVMARVFNTYGKKHYDTRNVIEKTIEQALTKDVIELGTPKPTRDFTYIDDVVEAYLILGSDKKAVGEIFNVCSGKEYTIKETVETIIRLAGRNVRVKWDAFPPRPNEVWRLCGDNTKMEKFFGWEPRVSLEEGLKRTIGFWKKLIKWREERWDGILF